MSLSRPTDPLHGVGLFSGRPASVIIFPIADRQAVLTRRGHTIGGAPILVPCVTQDTSWSGLPAGMPIRNTTLRSPIAAPGADTVATVEHILSACAGLGLWHVGLALEGGPEVPILDGSALPFVNALRPHLVPGDAPAPIVLREVVEVRQGDAFIRAEPFDGIHYTYELDYGQGSPIPPQHATWQGDANDFAANIAPARTFSLLKEAHAARAAGLFAHLTPREMLVIADDGRPIDNEWRLDHEPAKHKLLDLIGDLALLGRTLHARVTAHRAGHALTHEFCRRVFTTEGH